MAPLPRDERDTGPVPRGAAITLAVSGLGHGRQVQPVARTYVAATVITPEGPLSPGWVSVKDGRVLSAGSGRPLAGSSDVRDLGGLTLLPGFVDMHVHGGGGAAFTDGPEEAQRVLETHAAHGTTSSVASLVSDSVE